MVSVFKFFRSIKPQKGFMTFLIIILGVISVVGIALFSLNMQSRETFFLVHYYYLDSAREQIAESIQSEANDWLKTEMSSLESDAKNLLLQKFEEAEDFSIELNDTAFLDSIKHSKEIAEFVGFEISAKIHFKDLLPFFGESSSKKFDSDGLIYPNPSERRGVFSIEVNLSKDGVSKRVYSAWHNFRFVNILPPVVSRFTFFLKNQNEENGFVGKLNSLPMDLNRSKKVLRKGIIETQRSTVRPLVIINSLKDYDYFGQTDRNIRQFEPTDSQTNIDEKGWVFLGTEEPNGVILNLAGFSAFNYDNGGVMFGPVSRMDSSGSFYYGDYFHRGLTQEFIFTTRSDAEEGGPTYIGNFAELPHEVPFDSSLNFRIQFELSNYDSLYKSALYPNNTDKLFSKYNHKRRFENYYTVSDPSMILDQGFTNEKDYRSQHPALIKPFGEYYYSKSPRKFFDSRSPTLIIGPVRRSYISKTNISQESDLHRIAPDYKHPNSEKPKPTNVPIPYFNITNDAEIPPEHNNGSDLVFDEATKLLGKDSTKNSPHFQQVDWTVFPSSVDNLIGDSDEAVVFYRDYLMSLVWFDFYLHSFNSMVNNGGVIGEYPTENRLQLNEIKSLNTTKDLVVNDDFFFSEQGEIFNGNNLHIKEYSQNASSYSRDLFKGKLGSLNLLSETFSFNRDTGEMNSDSYDLRFKATHLTDLVGFNSTMHKTNKDGSCELTINGIVYINSESPMSAGKPEVLTLGCSSGDLVVKGKGILIYDNDIHITGSVVMNNADPMNDKRNQKTGSANPFGLIDIAPLTLISANGGIKIGNNVKQIQAYLIAMHKENGTISWLNGPPDTDVAIIGGAALHHFNLDEIEVIEQDWKNDTFQVDKITTPKKNLFHRNLSMKAEGRLRIIYNNSFIPSVKENSSLHYRFVTSKGVHLAE